ncbi:MAG: hypothetical protein KF825_09980 [Ferruginibacter sp.]|nr:hypothetical protein [Bacteroidota bacterium]MBX2934565.1 hypothetical protein [Ferruginibacter sp.]
MAPKSLTIDNPSYRSGGWTAVASGIIGIFVVVFLIAYLAFRNENLSQGLLFQRLHDGGLVLQFLLFIPVTISFYKLFLQRNFPINRFPLKAGIIIIVLTAFFALLIFPKILSDGFYTFPQGIFGVWLIVANRKLGGIFSRGLRWFGMVVGFGLMLVGLFFVLYATFVSTIQLRIPAAPLEEVINVPVTKANLFLHYFIDIGSLLGVLTFPFWTILIGYRLLRQKPAANIGIANSGA